MKKRDIETQALFKLWIDVDLASCYLDAPIFIVHS